MNGNAAHTYSKTFIRMLAEVWCGVNGGGRCGGANRSVDYFIAYIRVNCNGQCRHLGESLTSLWGKCLQLLIQWLQVRRQGSLVVDTSNYDAYFIVFFPFGQIVLQILAVHTWRSLFEKSTGTSNGSMRHTLDLLVSSEIDLTLTILRSIYSSWEYHYPDNCSQGAQELRDLVRCRQAAWFCPWSAISEVKIWRSTTETEKSFKGVRRHPPINPPRSCTNAQCLRGDHELCLYIG